MQKEDINRRHIINTEDQDIDIKDNILKSMKNPYNTQKMEMKLFQETKLQLNTNATTSI